MYLLVMYVFSNVKQNETFWIRTPEICSIIACLNMCPFQKCVKIHLQLLIILPTYTSTNNKIELN